jgi:hypothetical protein
MDQWCLSRLDAALVESRRASGSIKPICRLFDGRNAFQRVLRDLYDGQAIGVRSIPAFV